LRLTLAALALKAAAGCGFSGMYHIDNPEKLGDNPRNQVNNGIDL
jgi:hypothetical protein